MLDCFAVKAVCPSLLAILMAVMLAPGSRAESGAPVTNTPPASVGNVAQADWDTYCKWLATLNAEQLAWEKMLQKHLGVMDASAIALARDNRLPIIVFSLDAPGGFRSILEGRGTYTRVQN